MENSTATAPHLLLPQEGEPTGQMLAMLKVINRLSIKYVLPVIVLSGIIGNLLALAVFTLSPLRRFTISVYLAALSLTDIIFLVFLGLGWLGSLQINIFQLEGLCQTMVYLTFVVSFLSLWFIVIFTSELYFSIYCTTLHRLISRPKRALAITLVVTTFACFIYMFSFWLTRNVKHSETKRTCGFVGSRSAAIAVPIMDSVLTLVVPFSLLIFMYVRIVYTLASLSNKRFKEPSMDHHHHHHLNLKQMPEPEISVATRSSDNLLAKAIRMGTRIRRSFRNPRPASSSSSSSAGEGGGGGGVVGGGEGAGGRRREISSREAANKNSASQESNNDSGQQHNILVERVKKISLTMTHGEITINNSEGELLSIAKLVVKNDNLGITVSRRRYSSDSPRTAMMKDEAITAGEGNKGRRLSCGDDSRVVIKTKNCSCRKSETWLNRRGQNIDNDVEFISDAGGSQDYKVPTSDKSSTNCQPHADNTKGKFFKKQLESMEEEETKIEDYETVTALLTDDSSGRCAEETHVDDVTNKETMRRMMSMRKLKKRSLKMIISIAVIFVVLNLPSHAIRLQSMLRSLFDPSYQTSELELHLQQFFQTVYYFNFIANFITYSAFAKSFRSAFLHLPYHVAHAFSQLFRSLCAKKEHVSYWSKQRQLRDTNEHSRLVEICIPELHLSQIPSFGPDYKYVSPPCLLQLETTQTDTASGSRRESRAGDFL